MTEGLPEFTYERHEVGALAQVSDRFARSAHLDAIRDQTMRAMEYSLTAYVARNRVWQDVQRETEPATWWDAWKQKAPAWVGRRFPVRTRAVATTINVYHMCPHLPTDEDRYHLRHLWQPEYPAPLMP